MRHLAPRFLAAALIALPSLGLAQDTARAPSTRPPRAAKDPMQEGLPLKPDRELTFTTRVGHWMSVDVAPDGQTIVFDHLGDLYTVPIAGGKATALTRGMGMDAQPRFSPDGKRVAYVSDRDGGWNLWIISLDRKDTVQVTRGKTSVYESPEWTPDGKYLVVARAAGGGTPKLHLVHVEGGTGLPLVREPQNLRTTGPAFGKDPRYIWYARRLGGWIYNTPLGDYQLAVYDRETGTSSTMSSRYGSAFRPTLSPDGKWLVYGTRMIDSTGLRIRDLESGDERLLAFPVQRDDQESRATLDVYPGMSFTPDSRALVATWGGKLWRVPVDGTAPAEIPIEVDVRLAMGPRVAFEYRVSDDTTFVVKQIRNAVPSPDGRRLAFVAMDRVYVMDWPAGAPRRLTDGNAGELHPAWSRDGQWIAYATMARGEGGHLFRARADGRGRPQRLTTSRALYTEPAWSPDGRRIVAVRGPVRAYEEALTGGVPGGAQELVWIPSSGGRPATLIAPANGLGNPHFTRDSTRFWAYGGEQGLVSMRWDGTDVKSHLKVSAPPMPGAPPPPTGGPTGQPASVVLMAPDGEQALAQVLSDLYVVTLPYAGGPTPNVVVGGSADQSVVPSRRLTEIGGQFAAWSGDSKRVHWSIGNAHFVYDLDAARAFDDSVRRVRRERGDTARPGADTARPAAADTALQRPAASTPADSSRGRVYQPQERRIRITARRDIPRGTVVLRGARVITMRDREVIENADVVVRDNRIVSVGPAGSSAPAGARVVDVTGKTIVPGFVDAHAHLRATFDVHREQPWSYAANLAYGVTTARDPQTSTTDVLTYEDQVTAGAILGPRIYSTGPGVFGGERLRDLDHARRVLRRYSDYYDTKTIKQYVAGNREQRQWVIQAAKELRLMPTTEGSLDAKMALTEAFDGYSGHEHTWPTFPMQSDILRVFAESGIVYTPTILVAYGGPWAENWFYATENVLEDAKLRRFTPFAEIEQKALRRGGSQGPTTSGAGAGWFHPRVHVMKYIGEQVRDFVAAGGKVGVGSHGQLQGLGYHWELWATQSGGLPVHDALRAATIVGAQALGLQADLGSLEPGKLADLVVLDGNPLEDIRRTNSVRSVMKNGRLYDAATLAEVWPRAAPAPAFYWMTEEERPAAGLR